MAYEKLTGIALDYERCCYPNSKLMFRGPKRQLDGGYVAFLGGTETFGKFIEHPFADLVETAIGTRCVNFGWPNAGVDVFLNDEGVLQAAQNARSVVLQLPCAQNMSNRFYTVHPRRNDRFVEPLPLMREVFPAVDFSEFNFTRHLLSHLQRRAPDSFAMLRRELQTIWVARMRLLLRKLDRDVVLLWFSRRGPGQSTECLDIAMDPALVTRRMVNAINGPGAQLVEVCASSAAQAAGTAGMVYSSVEESAASELLGPIAHSEAAAALFPVLEEKLR